MAGEHRKNGHSPPDGPFRCDVSRISFRHRRLRYTADALKCPVRSGFSLRKARRQLDKGKCPRHTNGILKIDRALRLHGLVVGFLAPNGEHPIGVKFGILRLCATAYLLAVFLGDSFGHCQQVGSGTWEKRSVSRLTHSHRSTIWC